MPIQRYSAQLATDTTLVTTTETIVATVPGVNTPRPGCKVQLFAFAQVTTGTNTTGVIYRWRRGTTITDTVVGESNTEQIEAAAGSTEGHTVAVEDTPGEVAGQTYVFTVQLVAASANGSVLFTEAWADIVT